MNRDYTLLCPNCKLPNNQHRTLGVMTPEGGLVLLTMGHKRVVIKTDMYTLECQCGFAMQVMGTVITNVVVKPQEQTYYPLI